MPKVHYDISDLRALSEVARTGGFSRAADALSITQSALSRRISKLEACVGGDLIARSTRALALTALGTRLLSRTAPLIDSLDDSVHEASRIAKGLEGQVVLGCVSSIAYSGLPEAIAHFRLTNPEVGVFLKDGEGPEIMRALLEHEVEFAITTFQAKPAELVAELIASDPFVVVCGLNHVLTRTKRITWPLLAEQRMVGFKASSSTRRLLDEALALRSIELRWFDEVEQLSSLVGYLRSGHFVGVVPQLLAQYLPDVVAKPVRDFRIERTIYVARRRDSPLSVTARALWQSIASIIGNAEVTLKARSKTSVGGLCR